MESTLLAYVYLKNANNRCPVCLCTPCDCDGVNDEYRGVGETTMHRARHYSEPAGQRDRLQPSSDHPLESQRVHTKDILFSQGLSKDSRDQE